MEVEGSPMGAIWDGSFTNVFRSRRELQHHRPSGVGRVNGTLNNSSDQDIGFTGEIAAFRGHLSGRARRASCQRHAIANEPESHQLEHAATQAVQAAGAHAMPGRPCRNWHFFSSTRQIRDGHLLD
jgi:hypothetical protein